MLKMLRTNHRLTCSLQISRTGIRVGSIALHVSSALAPARIKHRPPVVGLKLFYAPARCCAYFIPHARARAKRAFLAANKLFNCLS